MRKIFQITFLVIIILTNVCHANLVININKKYSRALPILVTGFSHGKYKILDKVISGDLKNSDNFQLFPPTAITQNASFDNNFNFTNIKEKGIQYIIIGDGETNKQNHDSYNIKFKVINVFNKEVILARIYKNVKNNQFLELGHVISNSIYKAILGKKGYFTTKLAYVDVINPYDIKKAQYNLVVSDYDGNNPQILLSQKRVPISSPSWSPDGKYIAYVSYYNGRMCIYLVNVRTGQKKLVSNYNGINSSPAFNPESNALAVALSRNSSSPNTQIYLTHLYKKGVYRQLTNSRGVNTSPSFSPNGKHIVYTSTRDGNPQIFQLTLDSLVSKRLTFDGFQNFDPEYSPNGKEIYFMHQSKRGGPIGIAKYNLENGKITTLTSGPVDKSPSVSPNGNMVVYSKMNKYGGLGLAMVSSSGNTNINLVKFSSNSNINSPSWSPFFVN